MVRPLLQTPMSPQVSCSGVCVKGFPQQRTGLRRMCNEGVGALHTDMEEDGHRHALYNTKEVEVLW